MNSFLKTFQSVVEMGTEGGTAEPLSLAQQSSLASSSDPAVLKGHIATLTQQLARQMQSYEDLREESAVIEKELARLRLRFAASRELWDAVGEQYEVVIQNLLEHQLYGNAAPSTAAQPAVAAAAASPTNAAGPSYAPLDATYVASLQEQIVRLKEMVQRSGEERTQLRSEKQYEQTQILLRSNGLATAPLDDDVRQALEKMLQHWQEERAQYERVIEGLEQHVAKHAEREALLSDQVKQEKEQRVSAAAALAKQTSTVEQLREIEAELQEWRSGARSREATAAGSGGNAAGSGVASLQPGMLVDGAVPSELFHDGALDLTERETSTARLSTAAASPPPNTASSSVGTPSHSGAAVMTAAEASALREQHAELELLRQDYGAREEALDSLYTDNKHLQEALQRAEAQARQYDGELQECQRSLEEAKKELAREQQRSRRLEEDCHKAAGVEARLRDQVRELRHALTAAAAAAATSSAGATLGDGVSGGAHALSSGGGLSIPVSRGVRVGQPSRSEVAEQAITYEKGGTWTEWVVEVARLWTELKGDAVPLRHTALSGGPHARSAVASRRGPRVLLLFAGVLTVIMFAFFCLMVMESMYAAFKSPEVQ